VLHTAKRESTYLSTYTGQPEVDAMVVFIRQEPALSMQLSLYVTLGVPLLLVSTDHTRVARKRLDLI
jgi:hypothetical protein